MDLGGINLLKGEVVRLKLLNTLISNEYLVTWPYNVNSNLILGRHYA